LVFTITGLCVASGLGLGGWFEQLVLRAWKRRRDAERYE